MSITTSAAERPIGDREFIVATFRDATTIGCLLCDHTESVPEVPVSDQLGAVFGLSGETLARIHGEQHLKRKIAALRRHMANHPVDDWIRALKAATA